MVEFRRIVLSEEEFRKVLAHQIAQESGNKSLPHIHDIQIVNETPLSVVVYYQSGSGRQVSKPIDAHGAITAFIGLCQSSSIPISKISEKTIKSTGGGIAMDMTIKDVPIFEENTDTAFSVSASDESVVNVGVG